jgi:hypothetical protein
MLCDATTMQLVRLEKQKENQKNANQPMLIDMDVAT